MANSLNKVVLIGNLGRDPEFRSINESKEIATFTVATSDSWKDRVTGEKKEKTEWHRVVVFNEGLVKVIKDYLKKGNKIYLEGSLQTRKWVDNSGQEKYSTEIVLQNFNANLILLDTKNSGENASESGQVTDVNNNFGYSELDDNIPF